MLWRFLELIEEPSLRNGVWPGAASILCLSWTQHFVLLGGVAFWVLMLTALGIGVVRGMLRAYVVSLVPTVVLATAFVLVAPRAKGRTASRGQASGLSSSGSRAAAPPAAESSCSPRRA
jgi:hypothetical protein